MSDLKQVQKFVRGGLGLLGLLGGLGVLTVSVAFSGPRALLQEPAQEQTQEQTATEKQSVSTSVSTAKADSGDAARAAEDAVAQQLEELRRQREALDERMAATRDELEELDRQAEAVVEERAAAVRKEEQRLERAQREIEASKREVREERRDERVDSRRDDDWKERARGRGLKPKFGFGTTLKVRSSEVVDEVVSVFGGAKVDGDVDGDVTTIGGGAKINGRVSGSVTAFGGDVELGPHAVVEGDVTSLGGKMVIDPRASVWGEVNGGGSWDFDELRDLDVFGRGRTVRSIIGWHDWVEFFWALIFTGFLVLLLAMIYLVFRRPVERVRDTVFDAPFKAFLVGFLVLALSMPALVAVMIVLGISIIGIPILIVLVLLLPFALIGLGLALLYGYSAVALGVGGFLRKRLRLGLASSLVMLALGVVALRALGLCGDLLDAIGLPGFVTVLFGFSGLLVQMGALSIGLGAVILSRFGLRGRAATASLPPSDLPPVPDLHGDAGYDASDDATYDATDNEATFEDAPFGSNEDDPAGWVDEPVDEESDRS